MAFCSAGPTLAARRASTGAWHVRGIASLALVVAVLVLLPGVGTALAAAPSASAPDMPLGDVATGMKGFGLTAGPGDDLVQFPIRVLSVQSDAGPGFPLVLVRASGDFIDRAGGVAAGMSGTPIYLSTAAGPKLLGAVGYVFPSADHHLALVTPIGAMRAASAGEGTSAGPGPVAVAGLGRALPVATPVLLSGISPRAADLLAPLFRDPRLTPFPAQASGTLPAGSSPPYTLEPGSAITVELARGDVTIGAVGTVTAVEGASVLAFGHPLLGLGRVALPLAPAFVTAMVPSSVVPFKLANSGQDALGTVSQDRPAAIMATTGEGPAMIPLTLTVDAPAGSTTYHEEVAADARLYPRLVASTALQLLDRSLAETTAGYAQIGWEIDLAGGHRLNMVEQADDPADIATAAAKLVAAPLQTLADNAFRAPGVRAVKANVHLSASRHTAEIVDVVAENPDLSRGTSLVAHVRLQPYRQEPVVKTVTVKIPDTLSGKVTLTFRGGDVKPKGQNGEPPAKNKPRSFPELLDALRQKPQASELVVEAPDANGDPQRLERLSLPYVVTGSRTLEITVADGTGQTPPKELEGNGGTDKNAAPAPSPPPLKQPPDLSPPPPEGPAPNGDGA